MNVIEQAFYLSAKKILEAENKNLTLPEGRIKEVIEQLAIGYRPLGQVINERLIESYLLQDFTVQIGSAAAIYHEDNPEWINNFFLEKGKEYFKQWNNYKNLLKINGLPEKVINEIDFSTNRVLDGMANPNTDGDFDKKGMVVGYVQSGKTSNYIALANKAIDVGYKFIIILAGLHNNLRKQTQERVDEGIIGSTWSNGNIINVGIRNMGVAFYQQPKNIPQRLTSSGMKGDFNIASKVNNGVTWGNEAPLIAVVKKNRFVLANLNNWLDGHIGLNNKVISDLPVLFIDDECDQASIDTNFDPYNYEKQDLASEKGNTLSAINDQIIDLLSKFSRKCYVGYTATPYANVFIPINNEFYQNIFPKDFIVKLDEPSNYLGPLKYFGTDNNSNTLLGVQEVFDHEQFLSQLRKVAGKNAEGEDENNDLELPESLELAIFSFIISGGIRLFRGQRNKHMSMLIHVSRKIIEQEIVYNIIDFQLKDLKSAILNNDEDVINKIKQVYYTGKFHLNGSVGLIQEEVTSKYQNQFPHSDLSLPNDFETLLKFIKQFISCIEINISNSNHGPLIYDRIPETLENQANNRGKYVIAIGGDTLSRGLTLEGLHTSYFLRSTGNFDTLMQMGRWFGYRPNYEDLCRIFTTTDLIQDFQDICDSEALMHEDIKIMMSQRLKPENFVIRMRNSSARMAITGKMGMAGEQQISWAGGEVITNQISKSTEKIKSNWEIIKKIVEGLEKNNINVKIQSNNLIFVETPINLLYELNNLEIINNKQEIFLPEMLQYYSNCGFTQVDFAIVGIAINNKSNYSSSIIIGNNTIGLSERNSAGSKGQPLNSEVFKVRNSKLTDGNWLTNFVSQEINLSEDEKNSPRKICQKLKRPVITIVPHNPYFFFNTEYVEGRTNDLEVTKIQMNKVNELGNNTNNLFDYVPFGISLATPARGTNNKDLSEETIIVNTAII